MKHCAKCTYILSHLTIITSSWGMYDYYYHFTDKLTKIQGHTSSYQALEPELKLSFDWY